MEFIKKNTYLLLGLIVILAAVLRFYGIGENPPSLTWDEVAWGYNSYSLSIDGRDEFGKFLPLAFLESFGDYKPPFYAYVGIVPIKLFGLTEFATRFPSAFFGTITVLLTYFLVVRIFHKSKNAKLYALLSALILAVSPWHIMLSRAAFEANVANTLIVAGVWLFLRGVQEKSWSIFLSALCFVLSFYTFNTARIVSPLLVIVLSLGFYRELLKMKGKVLVSGIIGLVILLPALLFMLSPQAKTRFNEVNIFSDITIIETINQEVANDNNAWWSKILHNYRFAYAAEYLNHYFDHLKPSFLFITGDGNPKFSTQDTGQLYLWDLSFLIIGILLLIRKKEGYWWIIPLWLLIGIIPAASARETPHALRIESALPTFQILIAYGVVQLGIWAVRSFSRRVAVAGLSAVAIVLIMNVSYFWHGYTTHYANTFSGVWQYGYKEMFAHVAEIEDKYDTIYVTDILGRPYVYYLFYRKIDPEYFRENSQVDRDVFGFVDVRRVGKYHFLRDLSKDVNPNERALYVNVENAVPEKATILKIFDSLEKKTQFVVYTL